MSSCLAAFSSYLPSRDMGEGGGKVKEGGGRWGEEERGEGEGVRW